MKKRWKSKAIAIIAVAGVVVGLFVATQSADATVVFSQNLNNRPDSGRCGNVWARDTMTRSVRITDVGGDHYKVDLTDAGTFTAVVGEHTPSLQTTVQPSSIDAGVNLTTGACGSDDRIWRALAGSIRGGGTYDVVCADPCRLKSSTEMQALPESFDDTPGPTVTTGNWAKQFFKGPVSDAGITGWKWTYQTADETHVQSESGYSGNVTGKLSSKLTVTNLCRVSKTDKRNRWVVRNVRGDRARDFKYAVSDATKASGWTSNTVSSVAPGSSRTVTTSHGGTIAVHYYNGYGLLQKIYTQSNHNILC